MLMKFGDLYTDPISVEMFTWNAKATSTWPAAVGTVSELAPKGELFFRSGTRTEINRETYDALVEHFGDTEKDPRSALGTTGGRHPPDSPEARQKSKTAEDMAIHIASTRVSPLPDDPPEKPALLKTRCGCTSRIDDPKVERHIVHVSHNEATGTYAYRSFLRTKKTIDGMTVYQEEETTRREQ